MLKYYLPEKVDDITYSIDMLRLAFDTGANAQAFSDWIAHLSEIGRASCRERV